MNEFKVKLGYHDDSLHWTFGEAVKAAFDLSEEKRGSDYHIRVMRFLVPQDYWAFEMELKGPAPENSQNIIRRGKPDEKTGWLRESVWLYGPGSGFSGDDRVGTSFKVTYVHKDHSDLRIEQEYYVSKKEYDDGTVRYSSNSEFNTMRIGEDGEPYDEKPEYEPVGLHDFETEEEAQAEVQVESLVDYSCNFEWQGE